MLPHFRNYGEGRSMPFGCYLRQAHLVVHNQPSLPVGHCPVRFTQERPWLMCKYVTWEGLNIKPSLVCSDGKGLDFWSHSSLDSSCSSGAYQWLNYLITLGHSSLICEVGVIISLPWEWLWGVKEITYLEALSWCLAFSSHLTQCISLRLCIQSS